ncbi:MAG: hypothetical protein CSA05_00055 [Bacteroidia bacterium]|nr:MAG: hypothetical protein CSB01_00930 [Bacteroidia bacterium]PIE86520.1 MAG: hypothetical protein CSA05_00055 [Bacteroidia bacterium]
MKKYLFEGFLKEKLIYKTCKTYWEVKIEELFKQYKIKNAKPYLNTKFADGTDFFDANPIANYNISSIGRSIRIIQEEYNPNDLEIAAWIDEFETENFKTKELVISIQLRPYTEKVAFEMIKKWIVDNYPENKMEKYLALRLELEKLETNDKTNEVLA